jgi:hypothetical protein
LFVIAVVYTWPLLSQFTTAIPGTPTDRDVATMVWNVGWTKYALEHGTDLLWTDAVLVPFGADLRWHSHALLQGLLAYPLTHLVGVVGAYNLLLIAMLLLNGLAIYALVWAETKQPLAALVVAVWVMLASPLLAQFRVGRPSFACIWIVVGALLSFRSLWQRPTPLNTLALGGFLLAALFTDFQIVLFSLLWLALYGLYRWTGQGTRLDLRRLLALLGAALILLVPFLIVFYPAVAGANPPLTDLRGMMPYSYRIQDYINPALIPSIYGYELLAASLIAVIVLRWRGPYLCWLGAALFILLLALGPFLQPTQIPLPFAAVNLISPLRNFRTPSRLVMPALIGFGMVAGYALAYLLPRVRARPARWAVAFVAIGGHLAFALLHDPFNVQTYPTYDVYRQIASEPGDFALLEVPFGARSGLKRIGAGAETLQYYQHIHGKAILNGMIARLPDAVFEFYARHPALRLLAGDLPAASDTALDRDFSNVLAWSHARYVLVHHGLLADDQRARIEAFLSRQPQLEPLGSEGDLAVYQVRED